jgi:hypothetical protein
MTANHAPAMPNAPADRVPMSVARVGGVLCMLLAAGCAGIARAPEREAPEAMAAPGPGASIEPASTPAVPPPAQAPAQPPAAAPAAPTTPPSAAAAAPAPAPAPAAPAAAPASMALPGVAKPAPAPKVASRAPSAPAPAPNVERAPAPPPAAAPPKTQAPAAALAKPAALPPLDLKSLETRLRETKAIGVFTKLTVKNQVDDLLERFREFYKGRLKTTLAELRRAYDMLVLKVLALLQDADPPLASALAASRESIWGILSNPEKFSTL